MIHLEPPSFQSLALEAFFGEQSLGKGTGFVVQSPSSEHYLISNYHVLAGRHPESRRPRRDDGAVPDRLAIVHNRRGSLGSWVVKVELLYDTAGTPLWHEHPLHGSRVDVVALRLTELTDVDCHPYSYLGPVGHDVARLPSALSWGASEFVNIVGFPFGWNAGGAFGIWVQGAIASEPQLDWHELPRYLIDSRTRPGQSGSPVILYKRGGWVTLADRVYMIHNPLTVLIGIYSGRLSDQSDLGTVWKTTVIADILGANSGDKAAFVASAG